MLLATDCPLSEFWPIIVHTPPIYIEVKLIFPRYCRIRRKHQVENKRDFAFFTYIHAGHEVELASY